MEVMPDHETDSRGKGAPCAPVARYSRRLLFPSSAMIRFRFEGFEAAVAPPNLSPPAEDSPYRQCGQKAWHRAKQAKDFAPLAIVLVLRSLLVLAHSQSIENEEREGELLPQPPPAAKIIA